MNATQQASLDVLQTFFQVEAASHADLLERVHTAQFGAVSCGGLNRQPLSQPISLLPVSPAAKPSFTLPVRDLESLMLSNLTRHSSLATRCYT